MKELQLKPPLLMVIMGYPGAGKTHFSRQFTETHNLPYVSEDRIRYELFEKPNFNEDEADIITRIADFSLEEVMKTKTTVVYDGLNLSLKSRKRLFKLAYIHGYRTLTVWLQTDLDTSMKRAAVRDRRNPNNKYSFPVDKEAFDAMKHNLERPLEREESVVVSGKYNFRSQYITVLRKVLSIYSDGSTELEFPSLLKNELKPRVAKPAKLPSTRRPIIQ